MIRNVIDSKVKLGEVYGQIGVKCFKIASEFIKNIEKSGKTKDANGHVPIPDLAKTQEIEKYKSILISIEEYLIQEVMEISCYVSVEVIFKEFKDFLNIFYKSRQENNLNMTLYKLWKPIIFKSLDSPIHMVRYNSVRLLYDAYPIGDENLETSELQDAMNTQHAILVKLMRDDYPKIRILALQTVVRILIVGWDTILPATTTKWLKIWITHLSLDSSSPAVRQQAYIQLAKLIKEQDLAHPILNDLINKLSFGLHDVSDKVRSAFADVLLEVKETSIPYIEVSKIEMIMARVATEKSKGFWG